MFAIQESIEIVKKCQKMFEDKGTQRIPKEEEVRIRELKLKPGEPCNSETLLLLQQFHGNF